MSAGTTAFEALAWTTGTLRDLEQTEFPARVAAWCGGTHELREADATWFGFVSEGEAELEAGGGRYPLRTGMYFAVPGGEGVRVGGAGRGLLIARLGWRGWFSLGGPIEETGRLRYIDGCTDSLLLPPLVLGDPCLNLLHIPPHTHQTRHVHPSVRVGVIVSGRGECVTPEGRQPLVPGRLFVIHPDGLHSFHTGEEPLRVIAWHPDSDFGPTHENHPMINRTLIGEQGSRA